MTDALPYEVLLSIQRVLELGDAPADDPFDGFSQNFNVAAILNEWFPDEASLMQAETVKARLAETERELMQEIEELEVQLKQNQDPNRMQLIQELIGELLTQMSRIREKATESEAVVRNITKDIQVLDLAKKNLILSMTTLKRLQMLVNAVSQLEEFVKEKQYAEIAQTLAAVGEIAALFSSFLSVPKVNQVWKRIQQIRGEIRSQADADFDSFFLQDPAKQLSPKIMAEACQVVDVLGQDARAHIIERYAAMELKEYRRIFRTMDEAGQLDNLARRFAWFRRLLQTYDLEHGRVFPPQWRVDWHLFVKFVAITRDDLSSLLSKAGPSLTVKSLLDNLAITSEFEGSLSKKWATSLQQLLSTGALTPAGRERSISSAFEPHMSVFIDAQDRAISDMLAPHRKSNNPVRAPPRVSLDASAPSDLSDAGEESKDATVLPSSTELFYFYGQTLEQCAKLSTGKPLFDLCIVHKKWLKIYAEDVLIPNLKRPVIQLVRKSTESRFDPAELRRAALVLNTADYCQTTAIELEEKIREKIDEEFKEKITLQTEQDQFVGVQSAAIGILLREFDSACDPAFVAMARTAWTTLSQVTGQSTYSDDLVHGAEQVVEIIKPLIEQKKYLKNFFDKVSGLILAKFTNAIVRSRPLGEIGAEQLLIDLQAIRNFLTKMPGDGLATTNYTRALTKTATRLETLLKVIVTPVNPPEGFILNYTLLIGDSSSLNFQKVLDLKGTAKNEHNNLLDAFLIITSTKDLQDTSFLTELDMDPPSLSQLGNLASPAVGDNLSGIFSGLGSPSPSGPTTGSSVDSAQSGNQKQVMKDLRRLMSFGLPLRRDQQLP